MGHLTLANMAHWCRIASAGGAIMVGYAGGAVRALISWSYGGARSRVKLYVRVLVRLRRSNALAVARLVEGRLQRKYGVYLSRFASFPDSLDLRHPVGVVIGEGVTLGERVTIYQNVTVGGARLGDWKAGNYPTIGDDAVIFAGAVIVGKVTIGRNAIVGANAVVNRDVPNYATVAGVPARVIKQREVPRPTASEISE